MQNKILMRSANPTPLRARGVAVKKGREFAAWLGLVPRQRCTGGKAKLLGISKRAIAETTTTQGTKRLPDSARMENPKR
jgi:hypothetical protein